eukprot:2224343-Pleurochrysis_carterae.AAC.1
MVDDRMRSLKSTLSTRGTKRSFPSEAEVSSACGVRESGGRHSRGLHRVGTSCGQKVGTTEGEEREGAGRRASTRRATCYRARGRAICAYAGRTGRRGRNGCGGLRRRTYTRRAICRARQGSAAAPQRLACHPPPPSRQPSNGESRTARACVFKQRESRRCTKAGSKHLR